MHRFPKKLAVVFLGLALIGGACGGDDDESSDGGSSESTSAEAKKDPITVGAIFDLSGPTSDVGTPYAEGIKAYVDYLNKNGGLEGHQVNFPNQDYKYQVPNAETSYQTYVDQGAVAFIGWGTADTEALRPRVATDKVPFISASFAQTLANPKVTPFNFFPGPSYSDQIRMALKYISEQEKGAQTQVAVFYNKSPFGESPLADGQAYIKEKGLKIGFKTYAMVSGATDFVPELTQAKSQGAKYVIVQNVPGPAAKLVQNIQSQGLKMQTICLNYCADELLAKLGGAAAEGVLGITPFTPATGTEPEVADLVKYLEASGAKVTDKPSKWLQGWYTGKSFLAGIENALQDNDFDEVKDRATGGPLIVKGLEQIKDFKTGVSPDITWTSDDHSGMSSSPLIKIEGGKLVKVQDALTF